MIPAAVIAKMASLGLDWEQAEAVAAMLRSVEEATKTELADGLEARRANDRERKARQRHVMSRDVTGRPVTSWDNPPLDKEIPPIPPKENSTPPPVSLRERGGDAQARARVGGSRLPDEWAPSAALVAFAGDLGIAGQGFDEATAEFRDYWRGVPGQRGRKLDWDATFRNRLREAASRKKGTGNGNAKGSIVEAGRRLTERLIAERREREMRAGNSVNDGDPTVRLLPGFGR
jgi:hypothetical protein